MAERLTPSQLLSAGVYGLVRHPMYLGALLMCVGAPLLTGSLVALAVGVAMSLLLAGARSRRSASCRASCPATRNIAVASAIASSRASGDQGWQPVRGVSGVR